jgi:hypothetical protein
MIHRLFAWLMVLSLAQAAFAGPIQDGITRAARAGRSPVIAIAPVTCADAVLSCGYGAERKKWGALPWNLRPAGRGGTLTVFGADIVIRRNAFKVSKSVTF